jgi:branched-chain amino acid aminotransferase
MNTPSPLAYLNGRILPYSEAQLPLHDAGFVMGATIVDTCRTFRHRLFRWSDHLERFHAHCRSCSIALPQGVGLTAVADELLIHNAGLVDPEQELMFITFATPGPIPYYLGQPGGAGSGPTTVGMHSFPLPLDRYQSYFREGIVLGVPIQRVVNPLGLIAPQVKHRSRFLWWIADHAQRRRTDMPPETVALLADAEDDSLLETAIGNLLVVKEGTVRTPWSDTVLDGISLQVVKELCGDLAIPFEEETITLDTCRDADEAMLCGSAFCLAGVRQIESHTFPWPGRIFQRLLSKWSEIVGVDIGRQILSSR